ncbi:MAG: DUF4349 domain-containing protein [Anaerolineales bacterium]|nr:MAG: DUF4349 domain-containing protein [Anaerolineales bacterium]
MSQHIKHVVLLLAISILMMAGCSAGFAPRQDFVSQGAPAEESIEREVIVEVEREAGGFPASAPLPDVERIVIKNANLTIVVDDPSASMEAISRMAEEMGGFIVNAQLYQTRIESGAEVPRASITIRVPAGRLNEALDRIRSESERDPIDEGINSQDVTMEYTDLQSRLSNLEAAEAQLTEIMGSATKTEDVLAVYNQLVQVREQIEVIQGQIQYYERSAALSAITVEILANEAVQPLTIGGWQPVGVAKSAIQAMINTLKFLVNAVIWIGLYVLPVLAVLFLIFILPLSFVWQAWRKRRTRRKQLNSPPADQKDSG